MNHGPLFALLMQKSVNARILLFVAGLFIISLVASRGMQCVAGFFTCFDFTVHFGGVDCYPGFIYPERTLILVQTSNF